VGLLDTFVVDKLLQSNGAVTFLGRIYPPVFKGTKQFAPQGLDNTLVPFAKHVSSGVILSFIRKSIHLIVSQSSIFVGESVKFAFRSAGFAKSEEYFLKA